LCIDNSVFDTNDEVVEGLAHAITEHHLEKGKSISKETHNTFFYTYVMV
jgi:hypothetical protein